MLQRFSAVQKNIPQSKLYCNFESVLMFPQLKWCCNLLSSVPKLSHTYAVMLQRFSAVQKNIPQSKWYCNFESVLIFPQLKCATLQLSSDFPTVKVQLWISSDFPTVKVQLWISSDFPTVKVQLWISSDFPTVKVQLWISSDFPTLMPWCVPFFIPQSLQIFPRRDDPVLVLLWIPNLENPPYFHPYFSRSIHDLAISL